MSGRAASARRQRVFDSVFGKDTISQPTPVATPAIGFTPLGQTFGVPPAKANTSDGLRQSLADVREDAGHRSLPREITSFVSTHVNDQIRWDRSWHMVTHQLHLPNFPENRGVLEPLKPERETIGADFYDALEIVLCPRKYVPLARQTEDIVAWHTAQVRQHFLQQVFPILSRLRSQADPGALLLRGVKILETAHRQYLHGLSFIKEQIDTSAPERSQPVVAKFARDLHTIISNSSIEPLSDALRKVLSWHILTILGLPKRPSLYERYKVTESKSHHIAAESQESERSRRELLGLVESLNNVGLTGEKFHVIFAEIMNHAMTGYVYCGCKGIWSSVKNELRSESDVPGHLEHSSKKVNPSSLLPRTVCVWDEFLLICDRLSRDIIPRSPSTSYSKQFLTPSDIGTSLIPL
jgi:anaphase-promoting complex subunit 2